MEPTIPPPQDGWLSFPWSALEWMIMAIAGAAVAAAGWIWSLSTKLAELSSEVHELKENKLEVKQEISELNTKVDQLKIELPSRNFIETQLRDQTARIDQLFSSRLDRSRHL